MMDSQEMPVRFTNKGDAEAVKYNFFKMCFAFEVERGEPRAWTRLSAILARGWGTVSNAISSRMKSRAEVELPLRETRGANVSSEMCLSEDRFSRSSRRYEELPGAA